MTPLKLGIVGLSDAARPFAEAMLTSPQFELLGYCANDVPAWMTRLAPAASRLADPLSVINLPGLETLLVLGRIDDVKSVISAGLAQGLKVIVLPLAEFESTFAYDLSVTAIDDAAPLAPCFLHRFSPELRALRDSLHDASLVEIECDLATTGIDGSPSLNPQAVRQSFLSLADLICWIWGDYRRVTTVTAGADAEHPTRLTISLGGETCPDVVVGYRPAPSSSCRMSVQHPAGAKSVDLDALTVDDSSLRDCWLARDAQASNEGNWSDLMRAFDLLDGSQRSIRRRRTVEVSREFASERGQFKTQMTTAGCGILTYTFFAVLALLLVGSVLDPRDNQQRESEALGLVFAESDFATSSADLTLKAADRVRQISNALTASTAVVLIEAGDDDALDMKRQAAVSAALADAGIDNADARIVVRPLAGGSFRTLLIIGWIAAFLPLVIYLALQSLIVVTASPSRHE